MNTRRTIILACAVLLLAAGCHRRQNRGPDSDAQGPQPTVYDSTGGTAIQPPDGTNSAALRLSSANPSLQLQLDTPQCTDWRLFAPKQKVIYDSALLIGEWLRGSEHELYMADGTGRRWDDSEEVYREEAQHFRWTMDSNRLTLTYRLALGGFVPKQYLVTFADNESLVYRDAYGSSYMWDKVPATFTDRPANTQTITNTNTHE